MDIEKELNNVEENRENGSLGFISLLALYLTCKFNGVENNDVKRIIDNHSEN